MHTPHDAAREATLDAMAELVAVHSFTAVTMAQVASRAGLDIETLEKYFPDVESILSAWHEREVNAHLAHLLHTRDEHTDQYERLRAVLEAYARMTHGMRGYHHEELAALMHHEPSVHQARHRLEHVLRELIVDAAAQGRIRGDVAPAELVGFCLHSLSGASSLPDEEAVRRLVDVVMSGLR